METLSLSLVEDCWHELAGKDPAGVRQLVERFRLEQPVLSGFLLSAEDDLLAEIESGQLVLLGVWMWMAFQRAEGAKHEITEEMVEAAFDANYEQMRQLENASSPNVMDDAADWTRSYRQMPLLGGLLSHLLSGDLEETRRVDDQLGLLTLYLKTAIDCLDR